MDELILLTDSSVNTRSKIGFGAFLVVTEHGLSPDSMKKLVKVRRFEHTSSTRLELQTLLWALGNIDALGRKVVVYTDSQNIIGLPGRRNRFVQNGYRSKNKKLIADYALYKEFYSITDRLHCELVKVRGHLLSDQKEYINRLFTLVDRASRNALREETR